jgi:threonine/homoserine/homoserine lactone efflux protein
MTSDIAIFVFQAVVISLSGVISPGAVSTAALAAGVRRRHAGAWIAVGHGIVEFPLMVLIVLGAAAVLQTRWFGVTVGLAGGATLLLMGGMMIHGLRMSGNRDPGSGIRGETAKRENPRRGSCPSLPESRNPSSETRVPKPESSQPLPFKPPGPSGPESS